LASESDFPSLDGSPSVTFASPDVNDVRRDAPNNVPVRREDVPGCHRAAVAKQTLEEGPVRVTPWARAPEVKEDGVPNQARPNGTCRSLKSP
jgi:hypothetical protein